MRPTQSPSMTGAPRSPGTYVHSPHSYRAISADDSARLPPSQSANSSQSSSPAAQQQPEQIAVVPVVNGTDGGSHPQIGATSAPIELGSSSPVKVAPSRYRHSPYSPTQQFHPSGSQVGSLRAGPRSASQTNPQSGTKLSAFPVTPTDENSGPCSPFDPPGGQQPQLQPSAFAGGESAPSHHYYGQSSSLTSPSGAGAMVQVSSAPNYMASHSPTGSPGAPPSYRGPTHHPHHHHQHHHQHQQRSHSHSTSGGQSPQGLYGSSPHGYSASYSANDGSAFANPRSPPLPLNNAMSHPLAGAGGGGGGGSGCYSNGNSYAPSAFVMPPSMGSSMHSSPAPPPPPLMPPPPGQGMGSHQNSPMGLPAQYPGRGGYSAPSSPFQRSHNSSVLYGGSYGHRHPPGHGGSGRASAGAPEYGSAAMAVGTPLGFGGRPGGSIGSSPITGFAGNTTVISSKTASTVMADETSSSSVHSCSSASSVRDDLPLCTNDDACVLINDRKHQRKFAHTCRLFPCYHGHITRHAKLFRHVPGQIAQPEGVNRAKLSTHALTSVNFSTISPEAPNAYRIYVSHGTKNYEIFGDWATVKIHTFKRYLHQVYHIAPSSQVLIFMKTEKLMDDDISTVKSYDIEEDSVIQLKSDTEMDGSPRVPIDDL